MNTTVHLFVALVLLLASGALVPHGVAAVSASQGTLEKARIVRREGWSIPGLRHSRIFQARRPLGHRGSITAHEVTRLTIVPSPFARHSYIRARAVFAYDIDRRVFAYYLDYTVVGLSNGVKGTPYTWRVGKLHFAEAGVASGHWYYDMDGNGTFETVLLSDQDPEYPELPRWAQKIAARLPPPN